MARIRTRPAPGPFTAAYGAMSTFGPRAPIGNGASAVFVANQLRGLRVVPDQGLVVTKFYWRTGTASSGNYDAAILDSAGNRLWSKGSTAFPTISTTVTETVSPSVTLVAGAVYYLCLAADNGTATFFGATLGAIQMTLLSDGSNAVKSMAAAFPIPNPATLVDSATVAFPWILLTA